MTRTSGPRAFVFVLITVLVDTMGLGMIMPVLPTLIVNLTGDGLSRRTQRVARASCSLQ